MLTKDGSFAPTIPLFSDSFRCVRIKAEFTRYFVNFQKLTVTV